MKRVLALLSFLGLAFFLQGELKAQTPPAAFNTDCTPCHAGPGSHPIPTVAKGFGYGGWDAAFTRMRTFKPTIPAGDRTVIVNYLESAFPLSANLPTSSEPGGYATPPSLPAGTASVNYSQTMIGTGSNGPYTWSPISVSPFNPNLSISAGGVLSGIPSASGTFTITFTVTASSAALGAPWNNTTATFARSLLINPPPPLSITGPASLSAGTVGTAYSAVQFTSTGGTGGNVWTATGLPTGMSISAGGSLGGTPAVGSHGNYNPQFKVTDSSNAFTTVNRALTINPAALVITGPASLSAGTVGAAYSAVQFTASGGTGGNVWTATGLPSGMSISAGGSLSGTPAVGSQGNYTPQFKVTDSSNVFTTVNRALTINPAGLVITGPASLSAGTVGTAYSAVQFTASGGSGGNVWTATGLPSGMSISAGGSLSGTPAVGSQGNYTPQFKVTDSSNVFTTVNLALTINPAGLVITGPGSLSNAVVGAAYSAVQFTSSGGTGGNVWTATGLPAGMSISAGGSLSGTPAVGSHGNYNPQFKVTDSSNTFVTVILALTVNPPPLVITGPVSLPNGTPAVVYPSIQFTATGGVGGNTWIGQALPNGLAMSPSGLLSGTPGLGSQNNYTPLFTVTDSSSVSTSISLPLAIVATGPSISSMSPNPVPAAVGDQTVFVNGTNFQNGGALKVRVSTTGFQTDLQGAQVTFLSANQLSIRINVGTTPGNWTAQVFNPDGQSSNLFAFTVTTPVPTTFALPQFVFGGSWYTALYFTNPTNALVHIQVDFYGNNGAPLSVPLVGIGSVTSRSVDLAPQSTAMLETPLPTGPAFEGWVEVSLPFGTTGYAVFRQIIAGRADQEAVVPLTPESSQTADLTYDDVATTTAVAFLNASNQATTVTINSFDANGVAAGTAQVALAARSKMSAVLRNLPGLSGLLLKRGRVVFSVPNGAISVLGLRFGGEAFTSIPPSHRPAVPDLQTVTFALPQLVFGDPWYTALYFSNTTNAQVSFQVSFVANNGSPLAVPLVGIGTVNSQLVTLAPGATKILEAPNTGTAGEGWAEAMLPPGVTGYAVFRQVIAGRANQEAVVPLTFESKLSADLIYDDVLFTTSVAFLNPTGQQNTATITVFNANGTQIGSAQVVLPPRSKVATRLKDLAGLAGMAGNRGWASFTVSSGAVSVIGFRFGAEAFTSIPAPQR